MTSHGDWIDTVSSMCLNKFDVRCVGSVALIWLFYS